MISVHRTINFKYQLPDKILYFWYYYTVHACSITQSCPNLFNLMVCRPPDSSVQGIVQVRIQEYITISSCACMLTHSVMSKSFQPHGLQAARLLCSRDCPGKNTGVHCHFLLQGLFPTQGSNQHLLCFLLLCLLHGQADSLPLSHLGSSLLYKSFNNNNKII